MASHLHWADYLILFGFLAISLAIGVYHSLTGGRQKTTAEFIMGNRKLSVIPTAISLLVSFYSAITMLGMTAEMYLYGAQYLVFCIVTPSIAVFLVERFIIPWLYPLKLVSVFDYLERRFMSKTIRVFGAALGIASGVMHMGVAMYAPSAALESATGLPLSVRNDHRPTGEVPMTTMTRIMIGLAVSALLPAAAMGQKVSYDYNRAADFSRLRTYAIKDSPTRETTTEETTTYNNPLVQERINAAVASQLESRGLRRGEDHPDVYVVARQTFETRKNYTVYNPYGWGWSGYSWVKVSRTDEKSAP
jgi:hypothetical protein